MYVQISQLPSFRNKLECLSLNTRLGWKGLPRTNTIAYYRNYKLVIISHLIQENIYVYIVSNLCQSCPLKDKFKSDVFPIVTSWQICTTVSSYFLLKEEQFWIYKKRLVSRISPSLILKIILQNIWTLQQNNFDQIKSKWNYLQKIIKGPASLSVAHW